MIIMAWRYTRHDDTILLALTQLSIDKQDFLDSPKCQEEIIWDADLNFQVIE